jgi:TolB-like protein
MQWIVSKALRRSDVDARRRLHRSAGLAQSLKTDPYRWSAADYTASQHEHPSGRAHWDLGAGGRETIDSIAVLPLINSTEDPDLDYLSDGITNLINALAHPEVARLACRLPPGREIASSASAVTLMRAVLIGRMQRIRDYFTIGAELVDV